jgi:hypothetical protein
VRHLFSLIAILLLAITFFTCAVPGTASAHSTASTHFTRPACGWVVRDEKVAAHGEFDVLLWEYTCDGGFHAQLILTQGVRHGYLTVQLYYRGNLVASNSGYTSLNTNTVHAGQLNGFRACGHDSGPPYNSVCTITT